MKTTVEPPIADWSLPERSGANIRVATGHQAALWHPGILAKDIAMRLAVERCGGQAIHLVVDSDAHDVLRLDVPLVRDGQLLVETVTLGDTQPMVPTGMQPPADLAHAAAVLRDARDRFGAALAVDLNPLIDALDDESGGDADNLAQQIAQLTVRLMRPYVGDDVRLVYAGELMRRNDVADVVRAMLTDAKACAKAYNRAVAAFPGVGITPLAIERERVELPLWRLRPGRPRLRVFSDLADASPVFADELGGMIDDVAQLAPRALLLTAVMRSRLCDLFIHGVGGYAYDRITQAWWRDWRDEPLAPMTLVTADVYLDIDAPVADRDELTHAQWWMHHVPYNVDRAVGLDDALTHEKRDVLAHMDDDRDRARRARAFERLHAINERLRRDHPRIIESARRRLHDAKMGLANRRLAMRRDWCFALYPPEKLHALTQTLAQEATAPTS
jgi:hypothetical protein